MIRWTRRGARTPGRASSSPSILGRSLRPKRNSSRRVSPLRKLSHPNACSAPAALTEPTPEAQEAALAAGESLLAKGALGHNHFLFRRCAIEHALRLLDWNAAERHSEALLARMAPEPLPLWTYFARRGQLLARIGWGAVSDSDAAELSELRSGAAAVGLRIDALGDACDDRRSKPEPAARAPPLTRSSVRFGASCRWRLRPLSRRFRPFTGPILNACFGSN
jgi:hypothetical protein